MASSQLLPNNPKAVIIIKIMLIILLIISLRAHERKNQFEKKVENILRMTVYQNNLLASSTPGLLVLCAQM